MTTPDRDADPKATKNAEKSDLEVLLRVKGPELLQKHAANILMVVLLLAAAGMFLYSRSRNKAAEQAATNQNTAIAYDFAQQARELFTVPVFNDAIARERQQKVRDVFTAVELVLNSDAGSAQKAAAQLAKAEVLWQLGSVPEAATATTQPTVGFTAKSSAAYLDDAEQAYTEILSKYVEQKEYAANALLSLAAISETRGKFDEARKWYGEVIADNTLRSVYHDIATSRLKLLDEISKPYMLGPATSRPTTQPTSMPASFMPSFAPPSVPPSSMPVEPATTRPAE